MKSIVYLLGGMLIAFSIYFFWYTTTHHIINKESIITHKSIITEKSTRNNISQSSVKKDTQNKPIVIEKENNNTNIDSDVDIPLDKSDEEIYKEEIKDTEDETIIPIKTKAIVLQKVNITSLIASALGHGLKMKIKAKEKDGVIKVKAMFTSLMVDKEEAEKKKINADFITYIVAIVNNKIVFESTSSGFMSENPLLKFSFVGAKKGNVLIIVYKVLNGESYIGRKKIK